MTSIDEMPELIRRAEAAGRRVVIRHLIAPRTFERMLRYRHQLEVRVTHLLRRMAPAGQQVRDNSESVALIRLRRHEPRCTS